MVILTYKYLQKTVLYFIAVETLIIHKISMKTQKSAIIYEQDFDPLKFVEDYVPDFAHSETSTGFCNLSEIICRLKRWHSECAEITPVVVLRRNCDPKIIKIIARFGCQFVCGSRREIEELCRENVLKENIIWANNVLTVSDCEFAQTNGINWLQIGRISSLENILKGHPKAK